MTSNDIRWEAMENDYCDPRGAFTHKIKWIVPCASGFIVQRVTLEDELNIVNNYTKPYYEAWEVIDGTIVKDGDGPEDYDDCFSLGGDGSFPMTREFAINGCQRKLRDASVIQTTITYNCEVYWIDNNTESAREIKRWKRGCNDGISMADELRASFDAPSDLPEGKKRSYSVVIKREE